MPGPAPQPGETHRPDGNPWASADPQAGWWHGDTAAHPTIGGRGGSAVDGPPAARTGDTADDSGQRTGEAGPARAAAAADVGRAASAGRVAAPRAVAIPSIMGSGRTGEDEDRYDEPT
ncbi:MAG TPA: hypothetical protein VF657_05810, partial [Actinoplanes sp.]